MPTLIEGTKLVFFVKNDFEYGENLNSEGVHGNFWTIRILMQVRKTMSFCLNAWQQMMCFRLRF